MLLASFAPFSLKAEIIDRVAVSVERKVITESELLRQIRITAFLNGERPDFSAATKRSVADRLVEQTLIRREIETTGYVVPQNTSGSFEQFRRGRFKTDEEYSRALAEAGITDEELKEAFAWQNTLLEFINVRFRPGIQLRDTEVRDYYDQRFLPEAKTKGQPPPAFEEARDAVEETLLSERVDNALDRWLGQVRTQTRIRYREDVLR